MAVITRPDPGLPKPETLPNDEWKLAPIKMSVQLANALRTSAPMSMEELHVVREWFLDLADRFIVSGPQFGPLRHIAIDMHNRAVRRINGAQEEVRRRALEDPDRLLEIER